ncbi:MAG: hypothetical protein HONDAALG_01391 [Gammaproteobacteria bacterium]|nr:hypothetical protein [Gammaproteobacteria bacterium]
MPSCRNMPSMPKVRASSGTMGTICLPMALSFTSIPSSRTNAIVVEISRPSEPFSSGSKAPNGGTGSGGATRGASRNPPSASRRSFR